MLAPKKVVQEMIQIQRRFLWGGSDEVGKMAWIRWARLCLPKESGGMGIRNMELFNVSLLGKWKWRFQKSNRSGWASLLNILYGDRGLLSTKQTSTWWKELQSLDAFNPLSSGWFSDSIRLRLGNGHKMRFWMDSWCSHECLRELYPELFRVADNQNGSWTWKINWIAELCDEEQVRANELMETIYFSTSTRG